MKRWAAEMRRYLRLLGIFYKNTLAGELEYRLNFWSNLGLSLFWLLWAAFSVRVYFVHAETIAGWRYEELLIVMGLFFTMNGYRQLVLEPNLSRMSEYVRMGTLDYILTKPMDSQFLVSFRHLGVFNWADPLLGLGLATFALWRMGRAPSVFDVVQFVLLLVAGAALLYGFNLILQTLTIWLVDLRDADTIVMGLLETGRFPVTFYRGWLRAALTFVVPVAFMTTFPAQALLGRAAPWVTPAALALGGALVVAASVFWRYALRHYSGASG
jgi:ABC-2 type transport system permease protein